MSQKYITQSVNISDCSLEESTNALQEALDGFSVVIAVLPVRCSYSAPSDNMMRDYHYTESGFIIVGKR